VLGGSRAARVIATVASSASSSAVSWHAMSTYSLSYHKWTSYTLPQALWTPSVCTFAMLSLEMTLVVVFPWHAPRLEPAPFVRAVVSCPVYCVRTPMWASQVALAVLSVAK
jgi:hypothetical protein